MNIESLQADPYWPKWDSPWWHMTLLHEMGRADQIPEAAIRKMVERINAHYIRFYPVHPEEFPAGIDISRDILCHCAVGNIYQALAGWGLDVDQEIPWLRPWMLRYQLPDGGLNCDYEACRETPPPSSMVGTISPLEAILLHTPRPFTADEEAFLDRGARCLLDRQLMHASPSPYNAEEKDDEADWLKPCFPRFYFYDVLRGLSWILKWADMRNQPLPWSSIQAAVSHMENLCPDDQVRIARYSYEGVGTLIQTGPGGKWIRQPAATRFELLDEVSRIGEVSPFLTRQWIEARQRLADLRGRGLIPTIRS